MVELQFYDYIQSQSYTRIKWTLETKFRIFVSQQNGHPKHLSPPATSCMDIGYFNSSLRAPSLWLKFMAKIYTTTNLILLHGWLAHLLNKLSIWHFDEVNDRQITTKSWKNSLREKFYLRPVLYLPQDPVYINVVKFLLELNDSNVAEKICNDYFSPRSVNYRDEIKVFRRKLNHRHVLCWKNCEFWKEFPECESATGVDGSNVQLVCLENWKSNCSRAGESTKT